jgi:peptide/nickel transport system substrate-binding protein
VTTTVHRRTFLLGAAGLAGGVLAGCGASANPRPGGTGASSPSNGVSHAVPRKGGSLTFGVSGEETGFSPTTARFDGIGVMYARTVFDPLCIISNTGSVVPYLAESVVPNADHTEWTVTLRPGVVFHDGSPCDGAALLKNFEAALDSILLGLTLKPTVIGFNQVGPRTVVVHMATPWVSFPYYLAGSVGGQVAYVVAPAMLDAPNGGTDNPIGTGPFRFKEWNPNVNFTATRNERYWRPGLPYLDSITFKPIIEPQALYESIESGSVDILATSTPQLIVQLRHNSRWSYADDSTQTIGEPNINCLMLNLEREPFSDPEVRLGAC